MAEFPNTVVCPTYTATIYVGLQESYDGVIHGRIEAQAICRRYCDDVGLGLTVTPTTFTYVNGEEPGVIVGLINYPRFPSEPKAIEGHAFELAHRLKVAFAQERVSIVFPDRTVMIGET